MNQNTDSPYTKFICTDPPRLQCRGMEQTIKDWKEELESTKPKSIEEFFIPRKFEINLELGEEAYKLLKKAFKDEFEKYYKKAE